LRPKKAKEFIPDVANELNLPVKTVEDVISYHWVEVRKNLSALTHTRVHLTNLGDFVIKHWKLDDKIQMLERFEEKNRLKGMQQITARYKTAENLYDLKNMKTMLDVEQQRADFVKMHKRTTYESTRKHNQNLES
jgi:hypothetical protein